VIKFDPAAAITDLQPLVSQIQDLSPDMVYYPSLGMANYSLLLANMRLAPIQCFTLGHPASSFIDCMDYVIVQQQDFTSEEVYSERIVLTGNDTSPTINLVRDHIPAPALAQDPACINIAVTSKHMKINHSFLVCCSEIARRASKPVAFHFFPGVSGYSYEFVRHEILRILPDSKIYPIADYDTYIHNMQRCDIRLGTFPFGGANTNMDCFGLGIPFVIMDGAQPHARADTAQLRQARLPEWLIATDTDSYTDAALRLIDNNDERLDISKQMLELHDNNFFYKAKDDEDIIFDQTMMWLYRQHENIQQSDRRVWTLADQQPDTR
jgi:hypothetical protein